MKCFICGYESAHNEQLLKHIASSHKLQKYDFASYAKRTRRCEVCNIKMIGVIDWNNCIICGHCFDDVSQHTERQVKQEIDRL